MGFDEVVFSRAAQLSSELTDVDLIGPIHSNLALVLLLIDDEMEGV